MIPVGVNRGFSMRPGNSGIEPPGRQGPGETPGGNREDAKSAKDRRNGIVTGRTVFELRRASISRCRPYPEIRYHRGGSPDPKIKWSEARGLSKWVGRPDLAVRRGDGRGGNGRCTPSTTRCSPSARGLGTVWRRRACSSGTIPHLRTAEPITRHRRPRTRGDRTR